MFTTKNVNGEEVVIVFSKVAMISQVKNLYQVNFTGTDNYWVVLSKREYQAFLNKFTEWLTMN
ncbi:hypothetical protein ACSKF1_05785 [Lactiplantibacillus plantarum]|uniref:hypothetical protein n=1 Tax=Lactiplantibacillus plantarum TaxID=1590 RepID=UPI003F65762B